jgi:phosphopantetheinyl transferase (holo-ACP synthase)
MVRLLSQPEALLEATELPLAAQEPRVTLLRAGPQLAADGLREVTRSRCEHAGGRIRSRSYSYPYALIASFDASVGVDIEALEPVPEDFANSICTPQERAHAQRLGLLGPDRDLAAIRLWSAKEALAKALGDALHYDPRRLDSPLLWDSCAQDPNLYTSGIWAARQLDLPADYLGWACWRRSPAALS